MITCVSCIIACLLILMMSRSNADRNDLVIVGCQHISVVTPSCFKSILKNLRFLGIILPVQ